MYHNPRISCSGPTLLEYQVSSFRFRNVYVLTHATLEARHFSSGAPHVRTSITLTQKSTLEVLPDAQSWGLSIE